MSDVGHGGQQEIGIVKLNNSGTKEWSNTYGGTGSEIGWSMIRKQGTYIFAGVTSSDDYDVAHSNSTPNGSNYWIVKLDNDVSTKKEFAQKQAKRSFEVYPNPTQNSIVINLGENLTSDASWDVQVIDVLEKTQKHYQMPANTKVKEIDMSQLNHGVYLLRVWNENRSRTVKFIKDNR